MPSKKYVISFVAVSAFLFGFLARPAPTFAASNEKVLYSFTGGSDGWYPQGGLILDAAGNLYGTTVFGGVNNAGTVFELTMGKNGSWTEIVLYSFTGGIDGEAPEASLIFDATGNLYGTTAGGGANNMGTVFEVMPGSNGTWTESVLHNFQSNGKDGSHPEASLIFDAAGNLYGTTTAGGTSKSRCSDYGCGTVFEVMPGANGTWTEKVLHSFNFWDGEEPIGGLVFDASGNLYGTTLSGNRRGIVFQLTEDAKGKWHRKVLASRVGAPCDPVIVDAIGDLYGTSYGGGGYSGGAAFELLPGADGTWTEKVLHGFSGYGGGHPKAGLIFDTAGNLYGTTMRGGTGKPNAGVVFELTPNADGTWTETVLHRFERNGKDGANPVSGLVRDVAGHLYGTTLEGGTSGSGCEGSGCGTVFEITP